MEAIGYLASILMGLTLGITGGGGSILTVPILVYLFKISPVTATGYSLFVVGCTALVGGVSNFKRGNVALKTGAIFAVPSFVGVYVSRAFVLPALPEVILSWGGFEITKALLVMLSFAVLMLAASISMIRGRKSKPNKDGASNFSHTLRVGLQGFVVGVVTGFVGAGGGFLIVPALAGLIGLTMTQAVGTSLVIIATNSLFGFVGDLTRSAGEVQWSLLLTISVLSIIGIVIGMRIAKHLPDQMLKKIFGWFVFVMGSVILVEQLTRL